MLRIFHQPFLVLILYFGICQGKIINAQTGNRSINSTSNNTVIHPEDDTIARFPGGQGAWRRFFEKNLKIEALSDSIDQNITYHVVIKFIVTKEGNLKNFEAKSIYGHGIEEEVIRILKLSPNWLPARKNGLPINSVSTLNQTISF